MLIRVKSCKQCPCNGDFGGYCHLAMQLDRLPASALVARLDVDAIPACIDGLPAKCPLRAASCTVMLDEQLPFFDFGTAIELMKAGRKVARMGWNGKEMWLAFIPGDQWGLGSGQPYDSGHVDAKLLPWIGMRTAQGGFVPWLASQTDMLADDWVLVP